MPRPRLLRYRSGRCRSWRSFRRRDRKPPIALGRDVVADLTIDADAADIGHENARLARNVRAHVPGIGLRIERLVRDLVDVLDPAVLRFPTRFDDIQIVPAHMGDAVGNPVDMLLDRDDHVAEDRGTTGAGNDEQIWKALAHQAEI